MKTRLLIILLLLANVLPARARSYPNYTLYVLAMISDTVVYCEEKEITLGTHTKCKVLQAFKGDVASGSDLTVEYPHTFDGKSLPPGKSLLFLRKEPSGSYTILGVQYVQGGEVFHIIQVNNSFGPIKLEPMGWENLKLPEDHAYGEKELLEDLAIAMKKASSHKPLSQAETHELSKQLEEMPNPQISK